MVIKYLAPGAADLASVILLIGWVPAISLTDSSPRASELAQRQVQELILKVNSQSCVKISLIMLDLGLNFVNVHEMRD